MKLTFDLLTNYTIHSFIKDLLKKRFPNEPIKQIVYESGDKLNFACPYCGDSKKDPKKKRGNYYVEKGFYRCYNDGCGANAPASKFIGTFALKYSLGVPEVNEKKIEWTHQISKKKKGSLIETLLDPKINQSLLNIEYLIDRFSLIPCKEVDPDSNLGMFISSRALDNLPLFNQCSYFDSRKDKIYLFNLDLRSGKILGFAIRRIYEDQPGPKYLIKNYSEFKKNGLLKMEDSLLESIDSANNYFNIYNVNFSEPIFITEGQLDSMFLKNAIATTGISKSKFLISNMLLKSNTLVFFDSDSAGKTQSLDLIKKGYRVFLWNKVMADLRKKYGVEYSAVKSIKDVNDLYLFLSQHEPELTFEFFNQFILGYFSESALDLLYV